MLQKLNVAKLNMKKKEMNTDKIKFIHKNKTTNILKLQFGRRKFHQRSFKITV